jgi:hypothetical protein
VFEIENPPKRREGKFSAEAEKEGSTMTKFWMMVVAILALGLTTGCPDGDDCESDPSLCDPDSDTDSDAGADADADADSDVVEDDGDTSEVADCPSVAGDWALVYRNSETGAESHETLTLTQDGCLIIGMDDICEWSGTIREDGYISVFVDCYGESGDRTVTGNFRDPPHMEGGYWVSATPPWSGTWWADPQ